MSTLTVALVSSGGQCGIAEHSQQIKQHVLHADSDIGMASNPDWLDPHAWAVSAERPFDVVHLNYHRGLHSRWTAEVVRSFPTPFVITFHDTYEMQPDRLPWDLLHCPNVKAMVVHEPCDLQSHPKVHYWRQAVPERSCRDAAEPFNNKLDGWRPTLGTLGFDFPWKNYDLLAQVTNELGWNLRIVGQVSNDRRAELSALNPRIHFDGFVDPNYAVAALEQCDANAFLYSCANSGTSGAIRLGIAAGRPLIATDGCRQFRDLGALAVSGIYWAPATAEELGMFLINSVGVCSGPHGYEMDVVHFAHQERWPLLGEKYAALYREAANG